MATGPIKGPLGPICLVALACITGVVWYLGQDPQTAHLIAASPDRYDPTTTIPNVAISVGIGLIAVVIVALWQSTRRK